MDEKLKELAARKEAKLEEAKAATDADGIDKAMDEYDALCKEYDAHERILTTEKAAVATVVEEVITEKVENDPNGEYEKACKDFAAAARKGFNEGTPANGGYTVPEAISTKIEKFRDAVAHLRQLVSVKKVKTLSGEDTYQKRGKGAGFAGISEGAKIPKMTKPEFMRIPWKIEKYGGYMYATNEVLDDSDANLAQTVIEWFGENARVTDNKLVLATLNEKYTRTDSPETAKTIASLDDVKKIINVDLGQTFAPTCKIITNDDGLQWLDTLKDKEGNTLLKNYENDPLKQYVSVGFRKVPLQIIPNDDLPSDTTKGVPFYIGDFKAACRIFDRRTLQIKVSDTAAIGAGADAINAFGEDLTIWRGLERMDCRTMDEKAYHLGYYKAPDASAAGSSTDSNKG